MILLWSYSHITLFGLFINRYNIFHLTRLTLQYIMDKRQKYSSINSWICLKKNHKGIANLLMFIIKHNQFVKRMLRNFKNGGKIKKLNISYGSVLEKVLSWTNFYKKEIMAFHYMLHNFFDVVMIISEVVLLRGFLSYL